MRGETLATRGEHGAQRPSEHRFRLAAARDCARTAKHVILDKVVDVKHATPTPPK